MFQSYVHPYIIPWTLPLIQISLNGSIWSTVSVTLERYITVVHPRWKANFPTLWGNVRQCFRNILSSFSSRIYIVPVVLSTSLWNIPRFLELETCSENMTGLATICPTELRLSISYTRTGTQLLSDLSAFDNIAKKSSHHYFISKIELANL